MVALSSSPIHAGSRCALLLLLLLLAVGCGDGGGSGAAPSTDPPGGGGVPSDPDVASDPALLPRLEIGQLDYQGAFRLPAATFGSSSLNYAQGPIAYHRDHHSLFIVGHAHHQQIAEFPVPELVRSERLEDLNMAEPPLQTFTAVIDRAADGNPQGIDRIGGLAVLPHNRGPRLLVNAYEYYDAPGDNTHTTLVVSDGDDLPGSAVAGFFGFVGGAGHTSGWLTAVPTEWQALLGGDYLTGQSSGIPIISRCSVGPSAFVFDTAAFEAPAADQTGIETRVLLDFSLARPLHADLHNDGGDNALWTHLSRATFGMIVPGTRTYLTLGISGGHASGVCYKCVQDDGNLCGGYCAPAPGDYSQYYWLWDMGDLLQVLGGTLESHAVRPYAYGPFQTPFQDGMALAIGGGSYDPSSGRLYLSVLRADRAQGTYANPPVVVVYGFVLDD